MSCDLLDRDQTFIVQDYGPEGYIGTANVILQHGLQPGGIISAVTTTSEYMEINIRDIGDQLLLHYVNRIGKNDFGLNSHLHNKWGTEQKVIPIPVQKGIRTVTSIIYEAEGYRVFINGKEIAFYKHRSTNQPHKVELPHYCQIYKIIYLTTKVLLPR